MKPKMPIRKYGIINIYKMPELSPFPAVPPFSRLDSAAIRHIGHWAITSNPEKRRTNNMTDLRINSVFFMVQI